MSRYLMIACAVAACLAAPALLDAARAPKTAPAAPAAAPAPAPAPSAPKTGLAALADRMPDADKDGKYTGPDPAEAEKVYLEVLKGGRDGILGLVALLADPGGPDYKVRYLLHGIATYVARPGSEKDRQALGEAIASALAGEQPKSVKAFLLQELRYVGGKEGAAAASKFLNDEELCDPAAMALLAIGGTAGEFRAALPAAKGRSRVAVIQALGVLRDAASVAEIKKAAGDADRAVRLAAIETLANIGDPAAADVILKAADAATDGWDRTRTAEAALVLARRLTEAGNKPAAEQVYRTLWDTRTATEERHQRIAALVGLAELRGDISDLLAAMKTGDPQIRAVAIRTAASAPGRDATMKCVDAMAKAMPADRASLLEILAARGDPAALPAVLAMLKDPDQQVYTAAMQAAGAIGGAQAAGALVAEMSARTGKDREAAADALAKMRGTDIDAAVGSAMRKSSDPGVRAACLAVLGARRAEDQLDAVAEAAADKDASVRVAALKALGPMAGERQLPALVRVLKESGDKAEIAAAEGALAAACSRNLGDACVNLVAPALEGAATGNAAAMLRVLGAAGSRKAMQTVLPYTRSANAELKDAAVRALADCKTKEAAGPLMEIAQTTGSNTHRTLALRGIIRLAAARGVSESERQKMLSDAMAAAKRPEEKREILAGLGAVATLDALQIAVACLDDAAVREEAAAAIVQIAETLAKKNPDAVRDAVTKASKATQNDRLRASARKILAGLRKP